MSRGHRLFFALVPGEDVKAKIAGIQQSLAVSGRAAKPHQFHATLAFLGMQRPETIPAICDIASRLRFEPCHVVLDRLGQFSRAGVLWLGVSRIPDELLDFQQALVDSLLQAGIGHDPKPWQFHVTLYRKMRKPPPIMDSVGVEWALNGFDLVESITVGHGVEYHSIGHWKAQTQGLD